MVTFRLIAACLVAGLACSASTSSAGIEESRPGEVGKGEAEIDVVARMFLGSTDRRYVRLANSVYPWRTVGNVYLVYEPDRILVVAALGDGKPPVRLTGDPGAVAN